MKRLLSIILCLSFLIMLPAQAMASDEMSKVSVNPTSSKSSFIDGEGKENTIVMTVLGAGKIHSEYYIDGKLLNTVDANTTDGENINIVLTDANAKVEQLSLKASDLLMEGETQNYAPPMTTNAFSYTGRTNYRTYYDYFGNAYNYKLNIYQQQGATTDTYKTINAAKGSLASVVIAAIAAVLTLICPALTAVATQLLPAAAYAVGVTIVGGVVQGAISKRYYTRSTKYDLRADDTGSSRSRSYSGESFRIYLEGGGFSSDTYYEGYMPWNSTAVAYWMYCDFWDGGSYPGVLSFS